MRVSSFRSPEVRRGVTAILCWSVLELWKAPEAISLVLLICYLSYQIARKREREEHPED